jgi:hypothetical protein
MAKNENGRHQPGGQSTPNCLHFLEESTDHESSPVFQDQRQAGT